MEMEFRLSAEGFAEQERWKGCSLQGYLAGRLSGRAGKAVLNVTAWQLFWGIIATACKNSGAARKC